MKVDSAFKRRRKGDDFIQLFDENSGDWYEAEITEYSDGTYEFVEDNLRHAGDEEVESCSAIEASAVRSMSSVKDKIVSAIRELKSMRDDASVDRQSDRIESAIDHLNWAYGLLYM